MAYLLLTLLIDLLFWPAPASAQVTPTDDAQFRRQQENSRNDAAGENARIQRERSGYSNPAPATTLRSDPGATLDRQRQLSRQRDDQRRIDAESDRLRAEQQRLERERIFAPWSGQTGRPPSP